MTETAGSEGRGVPSPRRRNVGGDERVSDREGNHEFQGNSFDLSTVRITREGPKSHAPGWDFLSGNRKDRLGVGEETVPGVRVTDSLDESGTLVWHSSFWDYSFLLSFWIVPLSLCGMGSSRNLNLRVNAGQPIEETYKNSWFLTHWSMNTGLGTDNYWRKIYLLTLINSCDVQRCVKIFGSCKLN